MPFEIVGSQIESENSDQFLQGYLPTVPSNHVAPLWIRAVVFECKPSPKLQPYFLPTVVSDSEHTTGELLEKYLVNLFHRVALSDGLRGTARLLFNKQHMINAPAVGDVVGWLFVLMPNPINVRVTHTGVPAVQITDGSSPFRKSAQVFSVAARRRQATLPLAIFAVASSISNPIHFRPSLFAAAAVVPPPRNGSQTRSDCAVRFSIQYSASDCDCCQS